MHDEHGRRRSLWSRVKPQADGCWIWTGGKRKAGYGTFAVKNGQNWSQTTAHRAAYLFEVGPIPSGLEIDHLCKNRSCVRPDHLEPVTSAVNKARRAASFVPIIDRSPRPLPVVPPPPVPPPPPAKVRVPRSQICPNGHDKSVVGMVKNGRGKSCAACRAEQHARRRRGGGHGTETHCPAGHAYTPENTYTRPRGGRECKTCVQDRNRAAYYRAQGRVAPAERVRRRGDEVSCPEGHDMTTPANVGHVKRRGGLERVCLICRREINRRYHARKKAAAQTGPGGSASSPA